MTGPGLDLIDLKFLLDVRGEIFQVHRRGGSRVGTLDDVAERIRGYADAVTRAGREVDVRRGCGEDGARSQVSGGSYGRGLSEKRSTGGGHGRKV